MPEWQRINCTICWLYWDATDNILVIFHQVDFGVVFIIFNDTKSIKLNKTFFVYVITQRWQFCSNKKKRMLTIYHCKHFVNVCIIYLLHVCFRDRIFLIFLTENSFGANRTLKQFELQIILSVFQSYLLKQNFLMLLGNVHWTHRIYSTTQIFKEQNSTVCNSRLKQIVFKSLVHVGIRECKTELHLCWNYWWESFLFSQNEKQFFDCVV